METFLGSGSPLPANIVLQEAGSAGSERGPGFLLEKQHGEFLGLVRLLCADLGDSNIKSLEEESETKQYMTI